MNRRIGTYAAAAVLAAGPVAAPAAAAAVKPCAVGGITEFAGRIDELQQPAVDVAGWAKPCPGVPLPDTFIVVPYFASGGVVKSDRIVSFQSATEPTPFTFTGSGSLPLAVCVTNRAATNLACVRVELQGEAVPPLVYRIPVNDPVVTTPIYYGDDPDPHCGNCV